MLQIKWTAMAPRAAQPGGLFAGRMVKAVVRQRDRHRALQQPDDDDPYGDPQSSRLPVH